MVIVDVAGAAVFVGQQHCHGPGHATHCPTTVGVSRVPSNSAQDNHSNRNNLVVHPTPMASISLVVGRACNDSNGSSFAVKMVSIDCDDSRADCKEWASTTTLRIAVQWIEARWAYSNGMDANGGCESDVGKNRECTSLLWKRDC